MYNGQICREKYRGNYSEKYITKLSILSLNLKLQPEFIVSYILFFNLSYNLLIYLLKIC